MSANEGFMYKKCVTIYGNYLKMYYICHELKTNNSMKRQPILLILLLVLLFSCKKKKDETSIPAPINPPPAFDTTNIIGTWQGISERDYDLHNGVISNEQTTILNDTVSYNGCAALEFTSSKVINKYTASFYNTWNKDTVLITLNYATYQFTNNSASITFSPAISDIATLQIVSLTATDMVLRQTIDETNEEYTLKKINGHSFNDFHYIP